MKKGTTNNSKSRNHAGSVYENKFIVDPLNKPKLETIKAQPLDHDFSGFAGLSEIEKRAEEMKLKTKEYPSGRLYFGDVDVEGSVWIPSGYGSYLNGEAIYEGTYRLGQMHGQGVYTFQNGDTYNGGFLNDKPNGRGVLTTTTEGDQHETHRDVIFRNGELVCYCDELTIGTRIRLLPSIVSAQELTGTIIKKGGPNKFMLKIDRGNFLWFNILFSRFKIDSNIRVHTIDHELGDMGTEARYAYLDDIKTSDRTENFFMG